MQRELFALHPYETLPLSIDTMNKLIVSDTAPAVSRYHCNRKMYPEDKQPVTPDHDFPEKGYSVTAAGVLVLKGHVVEPDGIGVSMRITVRFRSVQSRKKPRSNAGRRSLSCPPGRLSTGCTTSADAGIRDAIKRWEGRDRHGRVRQITPTSGSHVMLTLRQVICLS